MSVLMFTDCLQIFLAALESPLERTALMHARVAIAQLAMALLVASIAVLVQHGGLESAAKIALVVFEFAAVGFIFFFFGVAQTHPPHFTRTIDTFSAGMFECAANRVSFVIIGHHYDNGAAFAQCILVNVQFIFGQPFENVALQLSAYGSASNRTEGAEYHTASDSDRKDRAHSGNKKPCNHWNQADAAGDSHCAADCRPYSRSHPWLLASHGGNSRDLLIGRMRRENRNSISWNIQGHQLRRANLSI